MPLMRRRDGSTLSGRSLPSQVGIMLQREMMKSADKKQEKRDTHPFRPPPSFHCVIVCQKGKVFSRLQIATATETFYNCCNYSRKVKERGHWMGWDASTADDNFQTT